jgi:hypothetical protein
MTQEHSRRGAQDRSRIHLDEPHDVNYWTAKLGVTAEQLRAAVKAAGPNAADVRAHLHPRKRIGGHAGDERGTA